MSAYFDLSTAIQRNNRRNRADIEALQEQVALQQEQIENLVGVTMSLHEVLITARRLIDNLEALHGYGPVSH
jgi:hypothetical protein